MIATVDVARVKASLRPSLALNRSPCIAMTAASTSDFRQDAATLFDNMRVPAALVLGVAISSAFQLTPLASDPAPIAVFKRVHMLLAITTIASELNAIVTATVAINKLSEVDSQPTENVVGLLLSDEYEFSWVAVNVQFFAGLFSLAAMVLIRMLATMKAFPAVWRIAACLMAQGVLLMAATKE